MLTILFGRFGQILLILLLAKLATTFLSTEEFGKVSQFLACISWFALVLINPVGMFINRKLYGWVLQAKAMYYFLYYFAYLFCAGCVVFLICFSLTKWGVPIIHGVAWYWLAIIISGSIIFNTINQTFIPTFNLFNYRGLFVVLTLLTLSISLLLSILLAYFISPKAEYWQLGQVLGQAVVGILGVMVFFSLINCGQVAMVAKTSPLSAKNIKNLLWFAIPVALSVGCMWVQTQSYRFIASEKIGLSALGLFFAGYSVSAAIIGSFEAIISNYFQPYFYKDISTNDSSYYGEVWRKYARVIFPPLLLTVVFIFLFSPEITRILLSKKFFSSYQYVYWGALAEAGKVVISTYGLIAHAHLNTKKLIIPNAVGAIVAVIFLMVLTPLLQAHGVGLALVLASLSGIVTIHFVLLKKNIVILLGHDFIKSLIFSGALVMLVCGARLLFPASVGLISALLWVGFFGIIYLLLMYYLLRELVESWKC